MMQQTKSKTFQWLCKNSPVTLNDIVDNFGTTSTFTLKNCKEVVGKEFDAVIGIAKVKIIVNDNGFVTQITGRYINISNTKIYFAPKPIDIQRIYDEQ